MSDIADIKKRSVTRDDTNTATGSSVWYWMLNPQYANAPGDLPAYWSPARDAKLRQLFYEPFHDFWTGAIGIAITKMASQGWDVTGDTPRLRTQAQDLLLTADNNSSWVTFLSRHLQDFLGTDNGAFIEIVRASSATGSRIIGLMHLDSGRITRTGDPNIPALYRDSKGAEHELKAHQVLLFSDMPSATETFNGVGFCATSRAWGAIKKLEVIERFIYEKIAGVRPKAIDLVGGVNENQLRTAVESSKEDNSARGYVQYMGAAVVPTLSDIAITHTRIDLASLPDGFDYKQQFDNCVLIIANAIGLDIQDLQPLSGQRLGTATQSEVLSEKSRGKGLAAWRQQITHAFNQFVLPSSVVFAFSEKDNREIKENADIAQTYANAVATMVEKVGLTTDQGKQILADADIIPDEFVPEDTTPRESLADDEKPEVEAAAQDNAQPAEPVAAAMSTMEKSIASATRKFHADLRNLVTLGFVTRESILSDARAIIKEAVRTAYIEGLKEGGVSESEIEQSEENEIDSLVAEQESHITDFVRAIRDAKGDKEKQRDILDRRVELWTASIESAGRRGLASAKENAMGTWRYGETEHCSVCERLNNQRHRIKWYTRQGLIPRLPGANMECGGYNCKCSVVDDSGKRLL